MRLALKELVRRPGRFVAAAVILTLISVLLMFIGGLLDGLLDSSTGAFRIQRGNLIAYSASSSRSLPRSRIPIEVKDQVAKVEGVESVGGFSTVQVAARPESDPQTRKLIPTILIGYELPPRGLPDDSLGKGTVYADSALKSRGIKIGDSLLLGSPRIPVKVIGFVDDSRYSGQISLWGSMDTWSEVTQAVRPGSGGTDTVQALVINDTSDSPAAAKKIEDATGQTLEVLTVDEAIDSLPGVATQRSTINQIIGVTVFIALVVISLFFALITIERTTLYGVLKAIGASSSTLFLGVTSQAVAVTLMACTIATLASLGLAVFLPPGTLPFSLSVGRVAFSVGLLLFAAIAGCAFSLRRVLRIDPAAAIGE